MKLTGPNHWIQGKRSPEAASFNHLVVLGLNYHSTPLAIRERFVIPAYCLAHALHALARLPHVKEAAVLSTCNRTEVYAVVSDVHSGLQEIESFFLSAQQISDHSELKPNFKLLREDVAIHLFRVASGLDSLVLGEGQIMSQVKAAHRAAQEAGTAGPLLDQLFKLALSCGKRVRSETAMARRAVSVSSAAVELARQVLGPLKERSCLVVGAGKMARICAKHLLSEGGYGPVSMINRNQEKVEQFAQNKLPNMHRLKTGLSFEDRYLLSAAADLVIVSTSAPDFVLKKEDFRSDRRSKELCIIDISVPRNVDPAIGELPGISLFHSDHLSQIVNKNLSEREALVSEAEHIVFQTLDSFHAWQRSALVAPTITHLRKKIEAIRVEQIRKTTRCGLSVEGTADCLHMELISRAIINQILHHPTVQLKSTDDYEMLRQQAEALRTLFNLDVLSDEHRTSAADEPGLITPSP